MSRPPLADTLPPTARAIALLLASTPTVADAQPGVLHQLLEFSHRYSAQVLSDAQVYAEHAGRGAGGGKIEMDDVVLAVQARVGWEFGGRVPKEYILSLATQTNSLPLPSVPEVFGVRLPPVAETLTSVDFDLIPNKPPPGVKIFDEEIETVEESESDFDDEDGDGEEDDDMELTAGGGMADQVMRDPSFSSPAGLYGQSQTQQHGPPISALQTPSDVDMINTPILPHVPVASGLGDEGEGTDEEEDGLFAGGDEDEESGGDDAMEDVTGNGVAEVNGLKRKLVEEEDYD
ncbi:hypothetical protein JAAARDRAFT_28333 [Jaapia argillacea MUCL 33604]|uniref:TFIID-31kDa-domain-containing protein n=1 Tax=Jaapia argillacea MUCL 33604 TaxID=933084 RepID=A0A067QC98_9AGAM|nr:hypothetical protein JAAARDRAFT_28333 [Jaapia argillacea MUCL 33604]